MPCAAGRYTAGGWDAGQQLGTGPDSIVHTLGPIAAAVGIIAGNRSIQPWFSWLIPGEDDGAVSVASTRLDEMRDFIVVAASHTMIMFNREARAQVRHFLRHGEFLHPRADKNRDTHPPPLTLCSCIGAGS